MATQKHTCSVADCDRPIHGRGYCHAHYQRWRRSGDALAGRTRNGEPKRFFEEVVLPYDGIECLIWPYANANGYGTLRIDGRMQYVSRLVCLKRHGPPPEPHYEAAHACGKGREGCVSPTHLSWKTPKENNADKLIHGTASRGAKRYNAKLTSADVLAIRQLKGTLLQTEIARRFRVCPQTISHIYRGKKWGWL